MFRIRRRIPPRFSGPRPVRFQRSSSRIWTSRTQCSRFSITKWSRTYQHDTLDSAFCPLAARRRGDPIQRSGGGPVWPRRRAAFALRGRFPNAKK